VSYIYNSHPNTCIGRAKNFAASGPIPSPTRGSVASGHHNNNAHHNRRNSDLPGRVPPNNQTLPSSLPGKRGALGPQLPLPGPRGAVEAGKASSTSAPTGNIRATSASVARDRSPASGPSLSKRGRVLQEIVETETTYVRMLGVVEELYLKPLRSDPQHAGLTSQQVELLFSNIAAITTLNRGFLKALQERVVPVLFGSTSTSISSGATSTLDKAIDELKIGDIFLQYVPFFKMYTVYMANYPKAADLLAKLLADRYATKFQAFHATALDEPLSDKLNLGSLLIMPIQRVPRYKLLLTELMRFTAPENPDHQGLSKALDQIGVVANVINESIRAHENRGEILEIQALVYHFVPTSLHIYD
jgi:hypothetical protein